VYPACISCPLCILPFRRYTYLLSKLEMNYLRSMMRTTTVVILMFACTDGLNNGLARLPPMGYNTWYDMTGSFDEPLLMRTVDAHMELELPKFGYKFWNLDDLWSGGRYPNGSIYADPAKFPSGSLKPLCDYVHSKKLPDGSPLLCGVYSDRGTKQCGPGPGSYNHTTKDAQSFAAWGADYLKEDSCAASQNHSEAFAEYGRMRDALNATGRPVVFSLCGWYPWYSNPDPALGYGGGSTLGNLWRIGPDDNNWQGVLKNININSALARNAGPGGWNDPCLLLAEDWQGRLRMTQLQSRAQFSMWAVMASPLIISANIRNMSKMNVETYSRCRRYEPGSRTSP
jgi:alpha-galactosidase